MFKSEKDKYDVHEQAIRADGEVNDVTGLRFVVTVKYL